MQNRFLTRLAPGVVLVAAALPLRGMAAPSVDTTERSVTKLADNVYVIRHEDAPDQFPQSNTTVVIGERSVLVVDSCYLPSSAAKDIAQIRQWTDKPVRYVVNTHWHYDHTMGNGVYAQEFPSVAIIAQTQTAASMRGFNPSWFDRYPKRTLEFQQALKTNREANGKPLTKDRKEAMQQTLPGRPAVEAEFRTLTDRLPDVTFDHRLDLDLGGTQVRLEHLGLGNTAGDVIVYLPKEKILAAGDLLDYPVPYLGGGYPLEQIDTLRAMAQFDAGTIVPGHGELLHDTTYLNMVVEFLTQITTSVQHQVFVIGNGSTKLEEVRAGVLGEIDAEGWRQRFAGDDKDSRDFFDGFTLPESIAASYAETWRR